MRKIVLTKVVLIACALSGCSDRAKIERLSDGVIIRLADGGETKAIRLRVISKQIIQVIASPSDTFPRSASLMVLDGASEKTDWNLVESEDEITVVTPAIRASVSRTGGEVVFKDPSNAPILREQEGGGKSFTAVDLEGKRSYQIRQVFESPDDEAFYGLGAHQNGQMNYKGEDVELIQHNIVDVVPFLYSSNNYGILWDNYSISRFGDPRQYQDLNSLHLFNAEGKPGGLTADYYVRDTITTTRIEDVINYEFLETPQVEKFPKDVSDHGKVIWRGYFSSGKEGAHKFKVYASGYFKIWVDDKIVLDKWRQNWNPWLNKFRVDCKGNEKHSVRIEWIPDHGGYLSVKHLDPYPEKDQGRLSLSSEVADAINYYFIAGGNADEVIRGYRKLTGKAPIIPRWAAGYWQSRERYRNQKELLDVVREYRKRKIPLDNIVLDWQYWKDPEWGSHEFDLNRFPDPEGMVNELHDDLHAHIMISVWPKFNKGTRNYEEMKEKGFLFARNIEKGRKDWVGVGYESTFYDPFNDAAGRLFWKQIDKGLNSIGIDAWWLDATEPDMHSNLSIEERKKNMSPTALGPGAKYFNAYSLMNARSVYEGQRRSSPGKRVFILTRSAYGGQQRYGAVTWSGDIVSRWYDLRNQISAGVNFSLSGIPYWTMDIGGFAVEPKYYNATGETLLEWRELNTRWFQFGAFCPIFRSHGQFPLREIYHIAPEGSVEYNSMVYYDKLRYRLLPYIYSLAAESYFNDYTIMRGLVMDFNPDSNVRDIADQYMFGPSLLVNPVCEFRARKRSVYLPKGTGWFDFYSGQYFEGGRRIVLNAPLAKLPLLVKEGAIIPAGPDIQYAAEKPSGALTLYVFAGRDASFTLYEDEGDNNNYEKGQYATIPLKYDEAAHTLTIGVRHGSFPGMIRNRKIEIVWVTKDTPAGVGLTTGPHETFDYSGDVLRIKHQ